MTTAPSSALKFAEPIGSSYLIQTEGADKLPLHLGIPVYLGIVKALRSDVAAGWLDTVGELIHAATFSDLLEQAEELLNKGYKDAAAVIVGSVVEVHLRELCAKTTIPVIDAKGAPKKADTMRTDFVGAQVFSKIVGSQVLVWIHLRNAAAHGNYGDYGKAEVDAMLRDVRSFLVAHPA